jgi:hypothetical protein
MWMYGDFPKVYLSVIYFLAFVEGNARVNVSSANEIEIA